MFPGTTRDSSMEKVGYPEVAGVLARYLARQQYYLAEKAKDADLLIAVYWGTTIPFHDANYDKAVDGLANALDGAAPARSLGERMNNPAPAQSLAPPDNTGNMEFALARMEMENRQRDSRNKHNAEILGYIESINDRRDMLPWADVGDVERALVADVEEERYYIVVRAYDFKALQRDGKQVVRWTTRISIGTRGTGFDERMAQMVAAAAGAFGQEQGLRRRFYGDPRVELGDVEYLGVATPAKPAEIPDKAAAEKKEN
jgi:hypothetical protein